MQTFSQMAEPVAGNFRPGMNDQAPRSPGQIITKDIFFVGYLLTRGLRIKELLFDPHSRRGKVVFVIEGAQAQVYDEEYKTESATANLAALKIKIDFAKDLMFDFLQTHETIPFENEASSRSKNHDIHSRLSR